MRSSKRRCPSGGNTGSGWSVTTRRGEAGTINFFEKNDVRVAARRSFKSASGIEAREYLACGRASGDALRAALQTQDRECLLEEEKMERTIL